MTKRQFLVTVDGDAAQDEKVATLIRGVLDGSVTVERLADKIGGFPAIWDADAPPGSVIVFQADKSAPIGHITPDAMATLPGHTRYLPPRDYAPTPEDWDRLRAQIEKGVSNPYGHIEVVQDDGTSRRPEPGEILTAEGLQRGFNHPERFIVEAEDGSVIGRFRTREQADTAADRWNQQDTTTEVYPATVRDLREETTHEN